MHTHESQNDKQNTQNEKIIQAKAEGKSYNPFLGANALPPENPFLKSGQRGSNPFLSSVVQQKVDQNATNSSTIQREKRSGKLLASIQGLAMYALLSGLEALPREVRTDEEEGNLVGGSRLVLAMQAVKVKLNETGFISLNPAILNNLQEHNKDQYDDIMSYISPSIQKELSISSTADIDAIQNARNQIEVNKIKEQEVEVINPIILDKFPHGSYNDSIRFRLFGKLATGLNNRVKSQEALRITKKNLDDLQNRKAKLTEINTLDKKQQTNIEKLDREISKYINDIQSKENDLKSNRENIDKEIDESKAKVLAHYTAKIEELNNHQVTKDTEFKNSKQKIGNSKVSTSTQEKQLDQIEKSYITDKEKRNLQISTLENRVKDVQDNELTTIYNMKTYQGKFQDGSKITLNPMKNNLLELNRPGGFFSGGQASLEVDDESLNNILDNIFKTDDEKKRAKQIAKTWGTNEGKGDSLNTWDVAKLTLGPGLAMNGQLNIAFDTFFTDAKYAQVANELFGKFGIGVENKKLTVIVPKNYTKIDEKVQDYKAGEKLKGDEALNFIINDPTLLVQLVKAGQDKRWIAAMIETVMKKSVRDGGYKFSMEFKSADSDKPIIIEWSKIVEGLDESIITATYASLADETHAKGSPYASKRNAGKLYSEIVKKRGIDGKDPSGLLIEDRKELARKILENIPQNRRPAFENFIDNFTFKSIGL